MKHVNEETAICTQMTEEPLSALPQPSPVGYKLTTSEANALIYWTWRTKLGAKGRKIDPDTHQACLEAIYRCAETYNGRSTFATYAVSHVFWTIIKKRKRDATIWYRSVPFKEKEHGRIWKDSNDFVHAAEELGKVYVLMAQLSNRERGCLTMRFGLDGTTPYTLTEIASIYKVTTTTVRNLLHRAMHTIARRYGMFDVVCDQSYLLSLRCDAVCRTRAAIARAQHNGSTYTPLLKHYAKLKTTCWLYIRGAWFGYNTTTCYDDIIVAGSDRWGFITFSLPTLGFELVVETTTGLIIGADSIPRTVEWLKSSSGHHWFEVQSRRLKLAREIGDIHMVSKGSKYFDALAHGVECMVHHGVAYVAHQ